MKRQPKRIQRKRTKGWRMPKGAKYVGRPTRWGNPFRVGGEAWRFSTAMPYPVPQNLQEVIADYRYYALTWLSISTGWLDPLRDKDLCCWCPLVDEAGNRVPCHADVLLELANEEMP